jgi:glycosyltransferase involved in cell wall biosynthesis
MAKVIWYLLHYASTPQKGSRNRPYYLAKALQDLDCKPYVIAANSHHYLHHDIEVKDDLLLDTSDGASYIWLKTPEYRKNGFKRILNMFYFGYALWVHAKKIVAITQKPDVIIMSSPHGFYYPVAKYLAKKYNAKLIFEMRDLWPLALTQINPKLKLNPLIMYMAWIEKNACRNANYIVSLLPNAFSYLKTKGLTQDRYAYIPNGFGSAEQLVNQNECAVSIIDRMQQLKNENKFLVGYLGTHGVFNALEQLIDALVILQNQGDTRIHAVLAGSGIKKEELKAKAATLNNITFVDPIPVTEAQHFLSLMDVLFIAWHPLEIYKFGVSPDKVFSYMLSGKPIVHAINTSHDPTQMAECAFVLEPNDTKALVATLQKAANLPREVLLEMGRKGREYVLAHHDYKVLAKKYSELF